MAHCDRRTRRSAHLAKYLAKHMASWPEIRLVSGAIILTTQLVPGDGFELIGDSDDCFEDPVRYDHPCTLCAIPRLQLP